MNDVASRISILTSVPRNGWKLYMQKNLHNFESKLVAIIKKDSFQK